MQCIKQIILAKMLLEKTFGITIKPMFPLYAVNIEDILKAKIRYFKLPIC